jgi:hypothetical protein
MPKGFENNEDWMARDQGRIPTKGAQAAERASAGLGTSDDEVAALLADWVRVSRVKPVPRSSRPAKQ